MLFEDADEPVIKEELGMEALLAAFKTCFLVERKGDFWYPRYIRNEDGFRAIFEYVTASDWQKGGFLCQAARNENGILVSVNEFDDLNHCLIALALAATIAGVKTEDVIV